MGLDILSTYESFEIHSVAPVIACKLQHYIVQDGFLVFFTGQNPCLSVCLASFPLDEITVSIKNLTDELDCVEIFQRNHNQTHKIYAHKN